MDRRITLRHLEAFRAVMLRRSVTAAAESLEVTQPVVTRLIAEFEARIGVLLFERVKGRLLPTPEATLLLEDVHQSLMGIERIRNASENVRFRRMLHLEIASAPAMAISFCPAPLPNTAPNTRKPWSPCTCTDRRQRWTWCSQSVATWPLSWSRATKPSSKAWKH